MSENKKFFVERKIPGEIKALARLKFSSEVKEGLFSVISNVLAAILDEKFMQNPVQDDMKKLLGDAGFSILISGSYKLILLVLKSNSISKEMLEEDMKELKLDPILSSAIVEVITKNRDLQTKISNLGPKMNTLKVLNWRVDVGISNSAICKELQAVVKMKILTSDGKTCVFEVPQKRFHELRFNVATVLKEMELLENSRYLSIAESS